MKRESAPLPSLIHLLSVDQAPSEVSLDGTSPSSGVRHERIGILGVREILGGAMDWPPLSVLLARSPNAASAGKCRLHMRPGGGRGPIIGVRSWPGDAAVLTSGSSSVNGSTHGRAELVGRGRRGNQPHLGGVTAPGGGPRGELIHPSSTNEMHSPFARRQFPHTARQSVTRHGGRESSKAEGRAQPAVGQGHFLP